MQVGEITAKECGPIGLIEPQDYFDNLSGDLSTKKQRRKISKQGAHPLP